MLFALVYLLLRHLVVIATGSSDGRHNGREHLIQHTGVDPAWKRRNSPMAAPGETEARM